MIQPIEYEELAEKLARDTVVLLDAQGTGCFEQEHLPGAHRLDWDDLEGSARHAAPDVGSEVVVYCWNTTCTGSEVAAAVLDAAGYCNVRRYVGGKVDWVARGGAIRSAADS